MIYLPTQHNELDQPGGVARPEVEHRGLDPASGCPTRRVPMSDTFTTPGLNAEGDNDWLLLLTA